jgi:hypothetical protein
MRDDVSKKFMKDELCDLYRSPGVVKAVKSRRLRLARHVARTVGKEIYSKL